MCDACFLDTSFVLGFGATCIAFPTEAALENQEMKIEMDTFQKSGHYCTPRGPRDWEIGR